MRFLSTLPSVQHIKGPPNSQVPCHLLPAFPGTRGRAAITLAWPRSNQDLGEYAARVRYVMYCGHLVWSLANDSFTNCLRRGLCRRSWLGACSEIGGQKHNVEDRWAIHKATKAAEHIYQGCFDSNRSLPPSATTRGSFQFCGCPRIWQFHASCSACVCPSRLRPTAAQSKGSHAMAAVWEASASVRHAVSLSPRARAQINSKDPAACNTCHAQNEM